MWYGSHMDIRDLPPICRAARSGDATVIFVRRPHVATTLAHYVQKIQDAGGFKRYERNHLNALTNTFAPKLPVLPPELVRRVVEYAFHVGDY